MTPRVHAIFCAGNERAQRANAPFCAKTEKVKTRNEVNLTSDNYGVLFVSIRVHSWPIAFDVMPDPLDGSRCAESLPKEYNSYLVQGNMKKRLHHPFRS